MTEQICPFAIWRPGAQGTDAKVGYPGGVQGVPREHWMAAPKRGEVKHDSVGPLDATLGVLDTHPINSWQFTVDDTGIYQHYPVDANCWHGNDTDPDDDVRANIDLVGVEHPREAGGMALTTMQLAYTTQLTAWLMETRGRGHATRGKSMTRHGAEWLLAEHNEVGNTPTACPSGRIPWDAIMTAIEEAAMPERVWLVGDERAGLEVRGNRQLVWNLGVNTDILGDEAGLFVGEHWHNQGGTWIKVLP